MYPQRGRVLAPCPTVFMLLLYSTRLLLPTVEESTGVPSLRSCCLLTNCFTVELFCLLRLDYNYYVVYVQKMPEQLFRTRFVGILCSRVEKFVCYLVCYFLF